MSCATNEPHIEPDVVRFSVRARPDGDRGSPVREFYGLSSTGRAFLRHGFEPALDRPLYIDGAMRSLPGLGLVGLACSQARTERTRAECHNDDLWLNLTTSGRRKVWHCGREAEFGDGEALLSIGTDASQNAFTDTRFISFRVPFKPIAERVANVEDMICVPIRRDVSALRLLATYGEALMSDAQSFPTSQLQDLVANHVYDLVALTLGTGRGAVEAARSGGARAARLCAIKADIEASLDHTDLSAASIAARHRLPLRYLQRLFEADGITCTQFILDRRLARAHRMLTDPRLADRPVSTIAFDAGFNHLSRFNRTFRARFGTTPSDIRAQARRDH